MIPSSTRRLHYISKATATRATYPTRHQRKSKTFKRPLPTPPSKKYKPVTSHPTKSPNDYPIDPYQLRVPGTTTSLIFSKYGPPINAETFLDLIAKAQYEIIHAVVAARGDGPVPQSNFEWEERKLCVRISRPLTQEDLTWLMLAETLEGTRGFFAGLRGWFETDVTILDDTAGIVGRGGVRFW